MSLPARRWSGALCLLVLCCAPPMSGEVVVYLLNAEEVRGQLRSCSPDGELTIVSEGRTIKVLLEQTTQILLRTTPAPPGKSPHQLVLQDGTRLFGRLTSLSNGRLVFDWEQGRTVRLPLTAVRAVGFTRRSMFGLGRLSTRYLELEGRKKPLLFKALSLAADRLTIDGNPLPLGQVRAIHFPPMRSRRNSTEGWYARVMFDPEQLLVGLIQQIDGQQISLVTRFLGRVAVPRANVWKLVFGPPPNPGNLGYTLVADSHGKQILLLDATGKMLWSIGKLEKPHDVEQLADGTLLLAEYQGGRVRQVTRAGHTVWEVKGLRNPIDVDRMANGHTLVTEFSGGKLIEYDAAGKVVWTWSGLKYPNEADPVAGNRVLVTESGKHRVFLAHRTTRKILWEYTALKWPMDADLLPGGNVLITDNNAHRVIEVSRSGKIVWAYRCENPYEADKLANGNYLIVETGKQRVIEVTPNKRIVWKAEGIAYPVAATRY